MFVLHVNMVMLFLLVRVCVCVDDGCVCVCVYDTCVCVNMCCVCVWTETWLRQAFCECNTTVHNNNHKLITKHLQRACHLYRKVMNVRLCTCLQTLYTLNRVLCVCVCVQVRERGELYMCMCDD